MTRLAAHSVQLHPLDCVHILGLATPGPGLALPALTHLVSCGFPSPADDHAEDRLDLNELLVRHPAATFYGRAQGDSMALAGILHDAILVIDRALQPKHRDIVMVAMTDEFTCKRMFCVGDHVEFRPESEDRRYRTIRPTEGEPATIWGVVTAAVNQFRC